MEQRLKKKNMKFKKIILIIAAIGIIALVFKSERILIVEETSAQLILTPSGYTYDGEPFSGAIFLDTEDGRLLRLLFAWRGLKQGPEIHWYPNGRRALERYYKDGQETYSKSWAEDGTAILPH